MEPLQPTVRQGVAQLKDFITKLVDIEEKEGEHSPWGPTLPSPSRLAPPPPRGPTHTGLSYSAAHSLQVPFTLPSVSLVAPTAS